MKISPMPPLLREAIYSQPLDQSNHFTWVCGCVQYEKDTEEYIAVCSYHGGYEDALKVVADRLGKVFDLLSNTGDELPARVLRTRLRLSRLVDDCLGDDMEDDAK